ncbi:hypothetical protein [Streptomyces sp. MMBL 11-1]|uniref:hypothetical protein n=1 Tax=Streptomyces sp. MMBL 11-1 TaxID=3026420 RepID=UPI0023600789|nr:hypothetical protein [Streptomyces sp. MMBL 11-1]
MTKNSRPWVGDKVHDISQGRTGIITDVRQGKYILRPVFGMGQWESERDTNLNLITPRGEEEPPPEEKTPAEDAK